MLIAKPKWLTHGGKSGLQRDTIRVVSRHKSGSNVIDTVADQTRPQVRRKVSRSTPAMSRPMESDWSHPPQVRCQHHKEDSKESPDTPQMDTFESGLLRPYTNQMMKPTVDRSNWLR